MDEYRKLARKYTQIRYNTKRANEGQIPHGTPYGYTLGCRESCCRVAIREHQRKYETRTA